MPLPAALALEKDGLNPASDRTTVALRDYTRRHPAVAISFNAAASRSTSAGRV
ncbi:MAG: hypothetical protein M3468_06275 [Acidobacteriota bacterium]|nr:hypothetical protein [Acidobacteriota bacterium]